MRGILRDLKKASQKNTSRHKYSFMLGSQFQNDLSLPCSLKDWEQRKIKIAYKGSFSWTFYNMYCYRSLQ